MTNFEDQIIENKEVKSIDSTAERWPENVKILYDRSRNVIENKRRVNQENPATLGCL